MVVLPSQRNPCIRTVRTAIALAVKTGALTEADAARIMLTDTNLFDASNTTRKFKFVGEQISELQTLMMEIHLGLIIASAHLAKMASRPSVSVALFGVEPRSVAVRADGLVSKLLQCPGVVVHGAAAGASSKTGLPMLNMDLKCHHPMALMMGMSVNGYALWLAAHSKLCNKSNFDQHLVRQAAVTEFIAAFLSSDAVTSADEDVTSSEFVVRHIY